MKNYYFTESSEEDDAKAVRSKKIASLQDARMHERKENTINLSQPIPMILICVTMWHESKEEIMKLLTSILLLDQDQNARHSQANKDGIDPGYYEREVHIFFDDAFEYDKSKCESGDASPLNVYVKTLINSIEEAVIEVYKTKMRVYPPTKIVTPYGGRMIWTLPGGTKMIAHLKDKNKIRHKKRWSQVMYMYYLFEYRIAQLNTEQKEAVAQNTYVLALDGDIDFQPNAVSLLLDRMKEDPHVGAACGRIHSVGTGPMVWYQIFEYAIGHWLQKAAEHVIGCVLCSPGCFSLYRGRALMDVMEKYTKKSDEALHFVQYDQGEDRWLCTLMIKQRYRIEYVATSHSYTHAPEGFNEFYNQRRRWLPSTIANIFDLLTAAKQVIKTNNSISMSYIIYLIYLMFGTILGPGTMFLMMVAALQTVFGIDTWTSFLWNGVPLAGFMAICCWTKQNTQLKAASFISAIYSLLMMAVFVAFMSQIVNGIVAPSSVFFVTVVLLIFITSVLHPQEMKAVPTALVYYILIPSMYMLLVIYSVFNMNDVSWGTRENPVDAATAPAVPQDRTQKLLGKLTGSVSVMRSDDEDDDIGSLEGHGASSPSSASGATSPIQTVKNDSLEENGDTETISATEEQFWIELIEKYLKPLDLSAKQLNRMQSQLNKCRNWITLIFVIVNVVFVCVTILLEDNKKALYIPWWFTVNNTTMIDYLALRPIVVVFVVLIGLSLVIQFVAMLIHRLRTICSMEAKPCTRNGGRTRSIPAGGCGDPSRSESGSHERACRTSDRRRWPSARTVRRRIEGAVEHAEGA